ncbi:hypothetical protein GLOIN_2v1877063 [Rhizophagus clarus]|uniref:Uncharacterized protein n=1 Tax=Rhizophagus clarus TaxID=94130 RepID=A0A8H3M2R3_9GLOM|nr:hypothetical protein GLOIN_2v1877063 [Rhizophagus clarus]
MFNLFFSVDAKRNDSELIKRIKKEGQQDIHQKDKSSSYVLGYGRPGQNQYIPPIPQSKLAYLYQPLRRKAIGTRLQNNGKREYHYILDRSKIIAKLRESDLGDMEEFSDIPQPNLPTNEATDIPIFNVPEIIPPKIIPPQPEENLPKRDKKAEPPIASTSGTSSELQSSCQAWDVDEAFLLLGSGLSISDSGDSEVLVLSDVPDVEAIGGSAPTLPYFFASSSSWHTRSKKLSLFFRY